MKNNEFCINTLETGSIWGNVVDWPKLNKIAKKSGNFASDVRYCGIYLDCDTSKVYAVFHTEQANYFVLLQK